MEFDIKGDSLNTNIFGKLGFMLLLRLLTFYFAYLTIFPSTTVSYPFRDILWQYVSKCPDFGSS